MTVTLKIPSVDDMPTVIAVMASWQSDGAPVQLHPGDLGWAWRFGASSVAEAVRVWSRDGEIAAVGFLDGPDVVRMAVAPAGDRDAEFARLVVNDLEGPPSEMFPAGELSVEARYGEALRTELGECGWGAGEPWAPLVRDLSGPVEPVALRIETLSAESAAPALIEDRVAVHLASFPNPRPMTAEHWQAMAAGPAYRRARCVIAYDDRDVAVAATTAWSAGPGRPGLIEPLGVHRDHRGHGYGVAITHAAAAVLQELGSSSVSVATPSSNQPAVATYRSAGFAAEPEDRDFQRPR